MDFRRDTIDGVDITALFENGKIVEIAARPNDDRLWTGDTLTTTVVRYAPAQKAYFLKHKDGEILFPSKTKLRDGETVTVTIDRPATHDKSARAVADKIECQAVEKSEGSLESHDAEILSLLNRNVDCGQGVDIVIDEAEAATVIDVNAASPELSFLEANRIAAVEIFRQIRLRNLQGQILIDFLRLKNKEEKEGFARFIGELSLKDPRGIDVYGFTRLGLFELTRAKRGLSLGKVFSLVK